MPVMYSIEDILSDEHLFGERFMSDATSEKLNGIPPEHLRRALLRLQDFGTYPAYSTHRDYNWPQGCNQSIVTIGTLAANGNIIGYRFGLCEPHADDGSLHLWTYGGTVDDFLIKCPKFPTFRNKWVTWHPEAGLDQYILHITPVIDSAGRFQLLDWEVDPALKKFLKYLSDKISAAANIPSEIQPLLNEHGHKPDAITPLILDKFRHPGDYQ